MTNSSRPEVSPALRLVLDAVRETGRNAHHPTEPGAVSDLVRDVADTLPNTSPAALQAEVEAYADAMDKLMS